LLLFALQGAEDDGSNVQGARDDGSRPMWTFLDMFNLPSTFAFTGLLAGLGAEFTWNYKNQVHTHTCTLK
jgi:hypothetical protein